MTQLVIKRCSLQILDEYPNAHNARAHTRMHTRVRAHMHTHVRTCTPAHTRAHVRTHVRTRTHMRTHTRTHVQSVKLFMQCTKSTTDMETKQNMSSSHTEQ